MRRQVIGEGNEPIRAHPHGRSVDPDFASLVYPIELQENTFPPRGGGKSELFPIPSDACGQVSYGTRAWSVFAERTFDAPVMRKVERSPAVVFKVRRLRALRIPLEELPLIVEI